MKQLFRNKFIEMSLVKALVFGAGKSEDAYALFLGCIIIEIKTYNMFRHSKMKHNIL